MESVMGDEQEGPDNDICIVWGFGHKIHNTLLL